ncbi:unnamed protein product [Dibothriocephalus latus]|uniref:Uncharacterized protein n=1 Tax=Dibothriocephalus latus TaxID=60516 RepID=A0A3P7LH47_DIBLA|nr:unnamed protein product [Dibothriocephalus latus]
MESAKQGTLTFGSRHRAEREQFVHLRCNPTVVRDEDAVSEANGLHFGLWTPYVDDNFVVIERYQMLTFKERTNVIFLDIRFKKGEEQNNQLAFLGVHVCRKDDGAAKM